MEHADTQILSQQHKDGPGLTKTIDVLGGSEHSQGSNNMINQESPNEPDFETPTDETTSGSESWLRNRSSSSRLENLPAELRFQILSCTPDLTTLYALSHASPVLHAQYREHRHTLLRICLDRELDGFYLDAFANFMTRTGILGSPRTNDHIQESLESYAACLSGSVLPPDAKTLRDKDIRWMTSYHNSVARPLVYRYAQWALAKLRDAAAPDFPGTNAVRYVKLSRSEEVRVYRAVYRYETYYHLFGRNKGERHGLFLRHEINKMFFGLFDPWEADSIGCIDLFVRQKYEELFDLVKEDLAPTNERFKQPNGLINPTGSFDLDVEREDYMNGTVSRGLKSTLWLLKTESHERLVSRMERCLTHDQCLDSTIDESIGRAAQEDRRQIQTNLPTARDEAEQRREPIVFVGDAVSQLSSTPPLGWVLLWNGTYANIYGEYVPESLRRTGYVMWDERRWDELGARDFVFDQWKRSPELVEEIEMDFNWSPLGDLTQVADNASPEGPG